MADGAQVADATDDQRARRMDEATLPVIDVSALAGGDAEAVRETAARHFASLSDLVLIAVDPDKLGDALRFEKSRGGALFPHLYRRLRRDEIAWTAPLPIGPDGAHLFPEMA